MKFIFTAALLLTVNFAWQADRFPVSTVRVTSVIGETRGDHFHSGTDFAGLQPLYPVAEGELLYRRDYYDNPTVPVQGSGSYVVMAHNDNFISYYFHLLQGSIVANKKQFAINEKIALMGNSGHSTAAHLHYVLINKKEQKILNCLKHLPATPHKTKPVVRTLLTEIKDKVWKMGDIHRHHSRFKWKGEMKLIAIAYVLVYSQPAAQRGVTKIGIKVDGRLLKELDFSCIKYDRKGFTLTSGERFDQVCTSKSFNYKLGKFTPTKNKHTFTVYCEDINGNRDSDSYTVTFR
ncbi:MAG TPA: M23 family metallopeptidase [Spirochaetota bacterium]|nr:M23 family metallopeptidase [Spirochaetota bacterium]